MQSKRTSEKSRLLADTSGYDSNTDITDPCSSVLVNSASINNTRDEISTIDDISASGSSYSPPLTESTKSSRSRRRPKSISALSAEVDNYDILVDAGEPGTT